MQQLFFEGFTHTILPFLRPLGSCLMICCFPAPFLKSRNEILSLHMWEICCRCCCFVTCIVVLQKYSKHSFKSFQLEDISRCDHRPQNITCKISTAFSSYSLSRGIMQDDSWRSRTFEILAKNPDVSLVWLAAILRLWSAPFSTWLKSLSHFPQFSATVLLPFDLGVVVFITVCVVLCRVLCHKDFSKNRVWHRHNGIVLG